MNTNVNLSAPVGVLCFLGASFVMLVLGFVALHALVVRRFGRARVTLVMLAGVLAIYFGLVLVFSFASGERVLARGEEKHFCELDCHLAYSVADVRRAKTLGEGANAATARGEFYVVTVKTRFDETTISPNRGDGELYPNPRSLTVFDGRGRAYTISEDGQRALAASAGTPLDTPLRPGESYTTELVFDLPADASNPTLLINESDLPTHFIIGHENSPLHKKIEFKL
ncbi:MAG TPA: DUF4352 domain-containing protein [Pyrinomonadaceae bacterium]|nr:DUF4352 domain-containing protein [Pyrinomonadaceae bacterium]